MKMLWAETPWACLPATLAMVTDLTIADILSVIGHDGSETVDAEQPEPYCRRGFEWQEIVKAALHLGIALVEYPDILPMRGILLGTSQNDIPHAVAWSGELIHDPAGGRRPLNSFRHDSFFLALPISEEARKEFQSPKRG